MARKVWFSVFVLISIEQVFSRDCSDVGKIRSCDECIRCGADWCTDPGIDEPRCSRGKDDWCPSKRAVVSAVEPSKEPGVGSNVNPRLVSRTIRVGKTSDHISFDFTHMSDKPQVDLSFVNSTILGFESKHFDAKVHLTGCHKGSCIAESKARPTFDFCPMNGGEEFVTLKFHVDKEEAILKYHVPCACDCSNTVERNSAQCNKHGDYSCGVCSCHTGWKGDQCETKEECDRGDISGCIPLTTSLVCSDNGRCLCGGKCECFTHKQGSQYFDDYCTDICTTSSYCDTCIRNPSLGRCEFCHFAMFVENFNKTLMSQRDELNRTVWMECVEPTDECQIQYAAMKDNHGDTHVMVIDLCQPVVPEAAMAGGINITIPVILGVIALVAVATAAVGFTMYKKRSPPLPMTDPQYQNIGAEDCTGENPLYKPPTSSFKNPTYGKW